MSACNLWGLIYLPWLLQSKTPLLKIKNLLQFSSSRFILLFDHCYGTTLLHSPEKFSTSPGGITRNIHCWITKKNDSMKNWIVPVQNQLAVVFNMWYSSASGSPFFDRVYGSVVRRLDTTVGSVLEILRSAWNCAPTREANHSQLEFTLLPVHADMFTCLFHTKYVNILEFYNVEGLTSNKISIRAVLTSFSDI